MINGVYGVTIALVCGCWEYQRTALWGILAGIFRFVPYVGVWIAALLPIGLSVAVSPGWTQPLLVVGFIASVEVVLSNVIEPIVIASGTGLSSFAMLMAAVFWAWLWGPVGLLLAAPLTVSLGVLGRHIRRPCGSSTCCWGMSRC